MPRKTLNQLRKELVSYAIRIGCNKSDAEDIVQDVLLQRAEEKDKVKRKKMTASYLKVMIKHRFFYNKSRVHLRIELDTVLPELYTERKKNETHEKQNKMLDDFLDQHKYGYIIFEMTKRGLKKIKHLTPYVKENSATLYKRYQKLILDFKAHVNKINNTKNRGEGLITNCDIDSYKFIFQFLSGFSLYKYQNNF